MLEFGDQNKMYKIWTMCINCRTFGSLSGVKHGAWYSRVQRSLSMHNLDSVAPSETLNMAISLTKGQKLSTKVGLHTTTTHLPTHPPNIQTFRALLKDIRK